MRLRIGRLPIHIAIITVALLALYIVPTQVRPASFMQDDSYFYLQVASNIVAGHGSTFHQVMPTNGYHPLWLWISILSLTLAGGDKQVGLHIVFFIQIILSLGTAYFFYQIARRLKLQYWFVGLALILAFLLGTGVYGSEAHVNAFALTAGIHFFLLALLEDNYRNWVVAGLMLGLSILARLDNVFVVTALIVFGAATSDSKRLKPLAKHLGALAIAAAAVIIPYLINNLLSYDHLVPISGSIKSTFPRPVLDLTNLGKVGLPTAILGLLATLLAAFIKDEPYQRRLILGLGAGVLLHAAYIVLYTDHYTFWPWYYVSGVISFGVLSCRLAETMSNEVGRVLDQRVIRTLAIVFSLLLMFAGAARAWLKAEIFGTPPGFLRVNEYRWPDELAIWMREHLPADSIVAAYDWPGAIAYYSGQRILPLDGLMNDFQYNEDVLAMGINEYLCSKNVDYYFGPLENKDNEVQELEVMAPLYREPAGKLNLSPDAIVIRVREAVSFPDKTPEFAIWYIGDKCS